MHIHNVSEWEVRQFISSLPVVSEGVADPGEFAFLVIVIDERIEICNGVIVAQDKILASYICMKPEVYLTQKEPVTKISILAGVHDTSSLQDGKQYSVWKRAKEISCSSNNSDVDLVLIRLKSNLKFNKQINPIKLPLERFYGESTCFTIGFIFTITLRSIYQYKQSVQVHDSETCKKYFPEISNSICSLTNYSDKWNCSIDDGRIALCDRTLTGFIKRKPDDTNCTEGTPLIFSDVGQCKEFLDKELGLEHEKHKERFHDIPRKEGNFSKSCGKSNKIFDVLINIIYMLIISIFLFVV